MSRQEVTERVADWINNDEDLLTYCQSQCSTKDSLRDHIEGLCKIVHPYSNKTIYISPNGDDLNEVYWDLVLELIEPECEYCDNLESECKCDKCNFCDEKENDCECEKCDYCDQKTEYEDCDCEKCEKCKEILDNCDCDQEESDPEPDEEQNNSEEN